jgi:hypothetical protein
MSASNEICLSGRTAMVGAAGSQRSIGVTMAPTKGTSGVNGCAGSPFGTECPLPIQVPYLCGNRATIFNSHTGHGPVTT